jgi:hypothetical protein
MINDSVHAHRLLATYTATLCSYTTLEMQVKWGGDNHDLSYLG